ncbi:hypothetical protein AURDEDRAFT_144338 [Auricularia subglabra TFB-10046 SS5]|nr:hypothetical protein AURDEDRAFT_144338 [Auricularia subglabra TFB-10046 SS5]
MIAQFRVRHAGKAIRNVRLPSDLQLALRTPTRVRYRLLLKAYEIDHIFTACSSVQEYLEVMYDVLEVSRHVHEEYDITHRDISPFNILPRLNAPSQPLPPSTKHQPVFIRRLLSYDDPEPAENTPTCVLLDFDNAFWADRRTGASRTATPGFVARTLSLGRLTASCRFSDLPPIQTLTGMAEKAYLRFHGAVRYALAGAFHDESGFWVLSWSLLTALPAGALIEADNTKTMSQYINLFDSHRVRGNEAAEDRQIFFDFDESSWKAVLHPGFHSLAPFLCKLAVVVQPEYGWVTSALSPYHLHEAIQRIILDEIFRLKQAGDPLNVDKQNRRLIEGRRAADIGLDATAPRIHAARSEGPQTRSGKRSRTISTRNAPGASTSAATDGAQKKQKKQKTDKDVQEPAPLRRSTRQRGK